MKSTKQSVSFSSSKSISFMARGKGGFLNPFPSKRSLPLWFTAPWDKRVRKFCARSGKNSGKKNLWSPKHVPYPFYTRVCQCSKGFPVFQSCLSADYSWEKLSQGLQDESPWTWGTFWGFFSFSDSSWEPEERLQGNGLLFNFCMIKKWGIFKWWGIND